MKKVVLLMTAALAMFGCKSNKVNQFDGFIVDASMNTVTVKALTSDDTRTFSLEDADKTEANGLFIGNLIVVDYEGELQDVTPATKVATDATYANALGVWTMADPLNAENKMGVEVMIEGAAKSVNMETLVISSWEIQGEDNKIILKGQSIGNGETADYSQVATIVEKDGKFFMELDGTDVVYEKEN